MNEDFADPAQRRAVCERQWDEGQEDSGMESLKYPHVLSYVCETPWAILPATLATIVDLLRFRAAGGRLSAEDIKERLGAAERTRPTGGRQGSIAVLPIFGIISQRMNLMSDVSGGTSTERLGQQFRDAMADPNVSAIVLNVDSPGGSVFGVPELADEIGQARASARKPIVAVANSLMASAAYWIGSQADEVVITPGGQAGSIGVLAAHTDISRLEEMAGIKTTLISAGKYKTEGNEFEPLSPEARASIQNLVDDYYRLFVSAVARGRGTTPAAVRTGFGEGRVLPAERALAEGLADRIDTLDGTLQRLASGAFRRPRRQRAETTGGGFSSEGSARLEADMSDQPDGRVPSADLALRRRRLSLVR